MEPDVLYAVRQGERNEALKFSLRSLGNLPHRRVFIAGYCPDWVRGVTAVEAPRRANKFDSIEENTRCGVLHPEMGDHVIYMNDDFYFTQPVASVPVTHGGPIAEYPSSQELRIRMRQTERILAQELEDASDLLSYDGVHMPLPLVTDSARGLLTVIPKGCLWRTWYGNCLRIGGERVPNTKYKGAYPIPTELPTFLSTNPHGLGCLRTQLEDLLPKECPYV